MNQLGFVEVYHVREQLLYRFQAPLGVPWKFCLQAIKDIEAQIVEDIKLAEKQAEEIQAQMQKEQYNIEQPVQAETTMDALPAGADLKTE